MGYIRAWVDEAKVATVHVGIIIKVLTYLKLLSLN